MWLAQLNHRIKARLFRVKYRSSTSYPYLSGDSFASLADLVIDSELLRDPIILLQEIRGKRIVFCPSHLLEDLISLTENGAEVKILIVGNGDKNFHTLSPSIKRFANFSFIQNSFISDAENIFTLPIGLENMRLGVNGMIRFNSLPAKDAQSSTLVGPFSPTSESRNQLRKELFEGFQEFDVLEQRIDLRQYSKALHSHKYVLCPEGNGVDTHRLWETFYAGAFPLVQRNSWSDSLVDLGFPVIQLDSWAPLHILQEIKKREFESFVPKEIEQLWMPYWEDKFQKLLSE
jgi:hypothetical protein